MIGQLFRRGRRTRTASAATAAPHKSLATLNGTVGPGYTITLKQSGKPVKTLTAGHLQARDRRTTPRSTRSSLDGPKGYAKDLPASRSWGSKSFTVSS